MGSGLVLVLLGTEGFVWKLLLWGYKLNFILGPMGHIWCLAFPWGAKNQCWSLVGARGGVPVPLEGLWGWEMFSPSRAVLLCPWAVPSWWHGSKGWSWQQWHCLFWWISCQGTADTTTACGAISLHVRVVLWVQEQTLSLGGKVQRNRWNFDVGSCFSEGLRLGGAPAFGKLLVHLQPDEPEFNQSPCFWQYPLFWEHLSQNRRCTFLGLDCSRLLRIPWEFLGQGLRCCATFWDSGWENLGFVADLHPLPLQSVWSKII